MKKYTFLLAVMTALCVNAQQVVVNDTVVSVDDAKKVVVTEKNGSVRVEIKGTGEDKDYVYSYKTEEKSENRLRISQDWELRLPFTKTDTARVKTHKYSKWALVSGGIYVGFNKAVGDNPDLGVKMGSSVELAWDRVVGLQYRPFRKGPRFTVGIGVGWKNYRITDSYNHFSKQDGNVVLAKYDGQVVPKYSRLKVFSLRVPVMVRQKLGDDFAVSAGAVMNINTYSSLKSCYILEDGTKMEASVSGTPVRTVTCDLMGALSWESLGVFVKYTPMSVFKPGRGPEFKSISVGFGLSL